MRSRTEMVTTTFVDSEDDYSDENESEEDWRPSHSSKNGKKQKCVTSASVKKGRKRKSVLTVGSKCLKRKINNESDDDDLSELSEDDYDAFHMISGASNNKSAGLPPKNQLSDKNYINTNTDDSEGTFNLLLYVKDLTGSDLNKSNNLSLWRKDNSNLLQKYIRVKTSPEQYLFTSSSVYSSFDDKRISDFYEIKVKSIDSTNRRVEIINPFELQNIYLLNPKHNVKKGEVLKDENSDLAVGRICLKFQTNLKKQGENAHVNQNEVEVEGEDADD